MSTRSSSRLEFFVLLFLLAGVTVAPRFVREAWAQETPPPFILKWGSSGTGDGQFLNPLGVGVDSFGNVYVADRFTFSGPSPPSNRRIQKFDGNGAFLTKWGSRGTDDGQFIDPRDVAVDSAGNVFVVDGGFPVHKFDSNANFLTKWGTGGTGDGQFFNVFSVAVDASGNVYTVELSNHRIQKFDNDGNFLTKFGSHCVMQFLAGCFDPDGPGPLDVGDGQFDNPQGVAVDALGNIYVSDSGNHRVQKFDSDGGFLTKWGSLCNSQGSGCVDPDGAGPLELGDGQFAAPRHLDVDASGNVYVADFGNNRIQKFDSDGTFLTKWGSMGFGDGQFNRPAGIAVDALGNVYVSDVTSRIQKFGFPDGDGDGVPDALDLCPDTPSEVVDANGCADSQVDPDGDGVCSAGAPSSGPSACTGSDNAPDDFNPDQSDIDQDGVGDVIDPCPSDITDSCDPDASAAESVGPEGGSVSTDDGDAAIDIPPGALDDDTTISITDTGSSFELVSNLGEALAVFGIDIQPEGTMFNVPISITFAWDDVDNDGVVDGTNIDEDNLRISKDGVAITGLCRNEPGCDTNANAFTFEVSSLSIFTLFGPLDTDDDGVPDQFDGLVDLCPGGPMLLEGFLSPMASLVPESDEPPLPTHASKQGRTLPLKLRLACGGVAVTDSDVAPPEIVSVTRVGDAFDLSTLDLDSGAANDDGPFFRFSEDSWIFNLGTTALTPGSYELSLKTPEGQLFVAAFVLK